MSQIHWGHQVNANFATAADWTGGVVPGSADDAILDAAGTKAYVVAATTKETVASIQTAATAQLTVQVGAAAGGFSATAGSGAGANAGTIFVVDGGDFNFGGTIVNSGKLEIGSTGDATLLNLSASGALSGGGKVMLSDNANNQITATTAAATLTNVDNTISGAGTIGGGALKLINDAAGVIDASGATNALTLNTGAHVIYNAGLIEATGAGGGLVLDSTVHNTATGMIEVLDGSTITEGAGGGIIGGTLLVGASTHLSLTGFNLSGVTLKTQGTGTIQVNGATLNGIINQAGISVAGDADLFVSGSLDNAGTISAIDNNDGGENGTQIQLTGSTVLDGGGSIVMGGTTPSNDYIDGEPSGSTLTNVNETIKGAGHLGNDGFNTGWLTLVNDAAGVIDATDSATQLAISTGGNTIMTNAGLLEGSGAAGLNIGVAVNNVGAGRIVATNGSLVDLSGITITGGVFLTGGTGVIDASGTVTLVNVDNKGALSAQNGDAFVLSGTFTNSGDVTLAGGSNGASLQLSGAVTFAGGGKVVLSGGSTSNNLIEGTASGASLINVDNTISGAGTINLSVVNDAAGVIEASVATALSMYPGGPPGATFTNSGLLEGTGAAGLAITSTAIRQTAGGVILAGNGSQVALNGASVTGGTLNSTGSGVVNVGSATFNYVTNKGNIALANGSALNVAGTLVNSGVINLAGGPNGDNIFVTSSAFYLSGGGTMSLSGANISGTSPGATLYNIANTISGAGTIGSAPFTSNSLIIVNEVAGVIDANNASATLALNNGGEADTNKGLMEATDGGNLTVIGSSVQNTGGIFRAATGSQIDLSNANITGGSVQTSGTGAIDIINGESSASNLAFGANVEILNGDTLVLSGAVRNFGVITEQSGSHGGSLSISGAVTLSGTGSVNIGGQNATGSDIGGAGSGAVLTNDSTIVGEGHISVALINGASGVVDAKDVNSALNFDNTNTTIANSGLIESTGAGGLNINDAVTNGGAGKIEANSGAVNVNAAVSNAGLMEATGAGQLNIDAGVTGAGTIEARGGVVTVNAGVSGHLIVDTGVLDLTQSGVTNSVSFLGSGKLELNNSQGYTGSISGFSKTGTNALDLTDIGFVSAGEATFVENKAGTSGLLTVTNGSVTATITLLGNYSTSKFVTSNDGNGGTKVVDPTAPGADSVAASARVFSGAMAAFGADAGAAVGGHLSGFRLDHPTLIAPAHAHAAIA